MALLDQALDDGSFRFSFFLRLENEGNTLAELAALLETWLQKRVAELEGGENAEENGRHDILTGRLMVWTETD